MNTFKDVRVLFFCVCVSFLLTHAADHLWRQRYPPPPPPPAIRLPSVLECVNMDEARVQFVKNKNKSGGAREAGSGH